MGYVITIAQRKGGAGKTTLACQLAAALLEIGYRVGAIDLDDQKSFAYWARLRRERLAEEPRFRLDAPSSYSLGAALRAHRASSDFVIIDTAPIADFAVKRAVREADLVLVPLQLTPLDLDATLPTASLIGGEGRAARFFINRAPPRARIADFIREQIKKQGLPMLEVEFGARAAFAESIAKGAGVVETAPSSQAADEARRLARAV
ncbi:MAG: ParA family protein, partial [Parvularculaceae bacterium]